MAERPWHERIYLLTTDMIKAGDKAKAEMIAELKAQGAWQHIKPEVLDQALDDIISQEILTMLGKAISQGRVPQYYNHPCRECGKPYEGHPYDSCEAWS